jgi:hypothetical protein
MSRGIGRLCIVVMTVELSAQCASVQRRASPAKPDHVTGTAALPAVTKSVAGPWTLTIDTPIGLQTSVLTIALEGKKLTGTISREDRQAPNKVAGEFDGEALSFTERWDGPNGPLDLGFEGAVRPDGSLAGTATLSATGESVAWWATRAK